MARHTTSTHMRTCSSVIKTSTQKRLCELSMASRETHKTSTSSGLRSACLAPLMISLFRRTTRDADGWTLCLRCATYWITSLITSFIALPFPVTDLAAPAPLRVAFDLNCHGSRASSCTNNRLLVSLLSYSFCFSAADRCCAVSRFPGIMIFCRAVSAFHLRRLRNRSGRSQGRRRSVDEIGNSYGREPPVLGTPPKKIRVHFRGFIGIFSIPGFYRGFFPILGVLRIWHQKSSG